MAEKDAKESESSVSVVSKSGNGSFGSGEVHKSPAFGGELRKRAVKSQGKTVKKQLNFTHSDEDQDLEDLSVVSGVSNITARPLRTLNIDSASESLSSASEELTIPPCVKEEEVITPRYIPFEEDKADGKTDTQKKPAKTTEPKREMITPQAPKPKPGASLFKESDDKLAALERKFAKKPVASLSQNNAKVTKKVVDGDRKSIEYEDVVSNKTVQIVKLADTREMATFTAQQRTLK